MSSHRHFFALHLCCRQPPRPGRPTDPCGSKIQADLSLAASLSAAGLRSYQPALLPSLCFSKLDLYFFPPSPLTAAAAARGSDMSYTVLQAPQLSHAVLPRRLPPSHRRGPLSRQGRRLLETGARFYVLLFCQLPFRGTTLKLRLTKPKPKIGGV